MPGNSMSWNSTTVTFDPKRIQTLPSSSPITPPPITTSSFGTSVNSSAPVLLTIRFSSISMPESGVTSDPVAIKILPDLIVSPPSTRTWPGATISALPWIQSTLFFLKRPRIPVVNPATISSFFAIIFDKLRLTLFVSTPHASRSPSSSANLSLACSNAFEGIQPTFRQVPPSVLRISTQAVFIPSCAARMAAT